MRTENEELSIDHQLLELVGTLLPPRVSTDLAPGAFSLHIALAADLCRRIQRPEVRKEICAMTAMHPDPGVRAALLDVVAEWLPDGDAREAIVWLTHDPDDLVVFKAISLSGTYKIREAVGHLMAIVGRPSERMRPGTGIPVGVGHAVVLRALTEILGTNDPDMLRKIEDDYLATSESASPLDPTQPDSLGMVRVPEGSFVMGADGMEARASWFRQDHYRPVREVYFEAFSVDVFPVTNAQYDQFVEAVVQRGHLWCHPDEPPKKNHARNTFRDPRFGSNHPVVGIDWYDAWAYARWAGKELPSEEQWEKAARGPAGFVFPWGNIFDPERCQWAGRVFGRDVATVQEWREALCTITSTFPATLTTPVDAFPSNRSPYGVMGMTGNCWEYTRTNFFTRADMAPQFRGRDPATFARDPRAFVVIRGGVWSSVPEMLTTFFRGKDLFTDRHNEIGFRCVLLASVVEGLAPSLGEARGGQ